jgi:uncharacterized protein (TIGR02757 family)
MSKADLAGEFVAEGHRIRELEEKRIKQTDRYRGPLEDLYREYNHLEYVHPDPLEFLYEWDDVREREVVGLVASSLAYGRVSQILKSITAVLEVLGPHPADFLALGTRDTLERALAGFKHRFTTSGDISGLLWGIRNAQKAYGSLNECFLAGAAENGQDTVAALHGFATEIASLGGFDCNFLVPSTSKGSACKRLNLYLRWMVRHDEVDPGGWKGIETSQLIVPLDTHMFRTGVALGFTARRQADLKAALEITAGFRDIAPDDPVRYDFSLTRLGIRGELTLEDFLTRVEKAQG